MLGRYSGLGWGTQGGVLIERLKASGAIPEIDGAALHAEWEREQSLIDGGPPSQQELIDMGITKPKNKWFLPAGIGAGAIALFMMIGK